MRRAYGDRIFTRLFEEAVAFFKAVGIASIHCLAEDYFRERRVPLDTIVDNVIALDLKAERGALKRTLTIVKARMGAVDNREHELMLLNGRPCILTG